MPAFLQLCQGLGGKGGQSPQKTDYVYEPWVFWFFLAISDKQRTAPSLSHCLVISEGKGKRKEEGPRGMVGTSLCPGVDSGTWHSGERAVWERGWSGLSEPGIQALGLGGTSGGHLVQARCPGKPATYTSRSPWPTSVFSPLVLDLVTQHLSLWAFARAVNSTWIPSCFGWANCNLSFSSQLRHHLVGEDFRALPITFHPVLSNERPFSVTAAAPALNPVVSLFHSPL